MRMKKHGLGITSSRSYIIALNRWHSRLALAASLITVFFSLYAIAGGIALYARDGLPTSELFHWLTPNANFLTGFSACLIIPFAVEGIRKKHFSYPHWVAMLHYSGLVCTTLTMVFSLTFMIWVDPEAAVGGYNLYLHIVCPIMVIVSFFLVESGVRFSLKDAVIAMIPSVLYMAVYTYEVVIVGEENGGWVDMYRVMEFVPVWVAMLVIAALVFGLSLLIRWLYNKLTLRRRQRMEAGLWPEDVDPLEINIEIFGLGRYMGKHADTRFIELPLELIQMIAERYHLQTEELTKPYIRGFLDSLKEKQGSGTGKEEQA